MWRGFQLVGDSQLNRFGNFLGCDTSLCFSGITISELRRELKRRSSVPTHIILLIGTNDLMRDPSEVTLKRDYLALVKFLLRNCERLILVSTPVILRRADDESHFKYLNFLNGLVGSFATDRKVSIVDLKTYSGRSILRPDYFERHFPSGRVDKLHLNGIAFRDLLKGLEKVI